MSKPLIIVESPTKVRTIKKYLGKDYNVAATVGHIKDLPKKELGIDIAENFKPEYIVIQGKQKVIKSLKQAAAGTTEVYLAPDPDREGEAIAYHTADLLKKKGRKFYRVLFHELTKAGINKAIASPVDLDENKFNAQQARRILDRLVGYMISPLLWRKVKGGLSAGRVQSVAVRIICERELAIQAFNPDEYWSITALLEGDIPPDFTAKLSKKAGKKIEIPDKKSSDKILGELEKEEFVVEKITNKTIKRNPAPPFTTSKLQQDAIRKLRFTAKKTMVIAQQLYEGINIDDGEPEGLITYMRTDSMRISEEAALEAQQFIKKTLGENYSLAKPRFFKNKKKVQDAHEAIRPTSVFNTPDKLKSYLSREQFLLYQLIWNRFVASQMKQALIDQNSLIIKAGDYIFTASGSRVKFPGFMAIYLSADEEIKQKSDDAKKQLPELSQGMILNQKKLEPKQHFTIPPPRFSEASLVKELEENGIGRPSTYATILSTIRNKGYVELLKSYFRPTELGFIVNDLLVKSFPDLFDVEFTARLENNLDSVETADTDFVKVLSAFYGLFKKDLDAAADGMLSMRGQGFVTDVVCPECKKHKLYIKVGRNGHYLGCAGYPDCSFTINYTRDEKGKIQIAEYIKDEVTDKVCEKCNKPMVKKNGTYGVFLACSGYPECKYTESINSGGSLRQIGVSCPEEGCSGEIVEKKTKREKVFFGCNRYPDCKFATWDRPVNKKCSKCGKSFMVEKVTKKDGKFFLCNNTECGHREKPL